MRATMGCLLRSVQFQDSDTVDLGVGLTVALERISQFIRLIFHLVPDHVQILPE